LEQDEERFSFLMIVFFNTGEDHCAQALDRTPIIVAVVDVGFRERHSGTRSVRCCENLDDEGHIWSEKNKVVLGQFDA